MDGSLTPLGELIEAARERMKLSQNAAAARAETSGTTWRRIVRGVARFGGHDVPHEGAADTVARMAKLLGITPGQLEEKGRPDAAAELRDMLRAEQAAADEPTTAELADMVHTLQQQVQDLQAKLRRMDNPGGRMDNPEGQQRDIG